MAALSMLLADGITIHVGGDTWTFGTNLIIYLIVAAIVGIVAEFIIGWRMPFGIVGAVVAGIIGIWLMTQVIKIDGLPNFAIDGVQIIPALIGAIVLITIWHTLTYYSWRRRGRYSYRGR